MGLEVGLEVGELRDKNGWNWWTSRDIRDDNCGTQRGWQVMGNRGFATSKPPLDFIR